MSTGFQKFGRDIVRAVGFIWIYTKQKFKEARSMNFDGVDVWQSVFRVKSVCNFWGRVGKD